MARAKKRYGGEIGPGTLDPRAVRRAAASLGNPAAARETEEEDEERRGIGTPFDDPEPRRARRSASPGASPLPSSAVGQTVEHHPGVDSRKR